MQLLRHVRAGTVSARTADSATAPSPGIFCGSVVASTNLTCSGGSSSVFSIELKALLDSMCTSSIRYTFVAAGGGRVARCR